MKSRPDTGIKWDGEGRETRVNWIAGEKLRSVVAK